MRKHFYFNRIRILQLMLKWEASGYIIKVEKGGTYEKDNSILACTIIAANRLPE